MRNPVRGWRSARNLRVQPAAIAVAHAVPFAGPMPSPAQPLRIGLGLAALAFYLWIIHSYKLDAGYVAVLALGVGVLMQGGNLRIPAPLIFFGILIVWAALGLGITANPTVTIRALTDLVKLWLLSFFIFNVVRTAAELRFLTIVWLAVFALYPLRGALYNHFVCQCTEYGRVAWNFVFSNPNDLAALSLVPLGAAAGIASVERVKLWRYAGFAGVGVLALTVLLTQSRGAMLALGVAAIMLPLTSRRRGRDAMLLILVVGAAALVAPKGVWTRLSGLTNASVDEGMQGVDPEGSAESRWKVWQIAGEAIRDFPVTGVGLGTMPQRHRWEADRRNLHSSVRGERDTHSTYLRLAAETGVPGLLLYILMWGAVLQKVRRAKSSLKGVRRADHQFLVFIELSLIAFLVTSLFGTYGSLSFTYLIVAFAWLAADILMREAWYVPAKLALSAPVPAVQRRSR